jgi:hypothetical protein
MTYLLLTDHPPDAVDDIALPATIRSDDTRDTLVKTDMGLISKTLKPLYFQTL